MSVTIIYVKLKDKAVPKIGQELEAISRKMRVLFHSLSTRQRNGL